MDCVSRAKILTKQHAEGAKHQTQIQLSLRTRQTYLDSTAENQTGNEFFRDLTKCLIESNIPSSKVDNPHFEGFLEKYYRNAAHSSFTLRKLYLKKRNEDQIVIYKNSVEKQDFYIVVDECTDNVSRFIAGVMVGILKPETYSHPYLFELVGLETTDGATISQLVNTSISKLFEGDVPYEKFNLFLTDSASYMLSADAKLF